MHGYLGRGIVTYRRLLFEPANNSREMCLAAQGCRLAARACGERCRRRRAAVPGHECARAAWHAALATGRHVEPPNFDAVVNASAVAVSRATATHSFPNKAREAAF